MKRPVLWLLICIPLGLFSQTKEDVTTTNSRYFEDQFYAGITYNFVLNQPEGVDQRNFSYGLQAGFIKDIPFNNQGTFGIGLGLGLGLYTYYSNLIALDGPEGITYRIEEDESSFRRSKLETHLVEVPLEFRWRTSDRNTYSFWRVYAGVKFGYAFNSRSRFVGTDSKESFQNTDVAKFQYGLNFNFGFHNFNIHAYYSLTNLFDDDVTINENAIEFTPLRIGLIFYIL